MSKSKELQTLFRRPVDIEERVRYNPNLTRRSFGAVVALIDQITPGNSAVGDWAFRRYRSRVLRVGLDRAGAGACPAQDITREHSSGETPKGQKEQQFQNNNKKESSYNNKKDISYGRQNDSGNIR